MSFLVVLFLPFSSYAYTDLYKERSIDKLPQLQMKYERRRFLYDSCQFEKRRQGFLWPCFIVEKENWDQSSMDQHCNRHIPYIQNIRKLPNEDDTLKLSQDCQKLITERRRILDYKANGP